MSFLLGVAAVYAMLLIGLMPCADAMGSQWCSHCNHVHLRETKHVEQGVPFVMKGRTYEINETPRLQLSSVTLQNDIYAYACAHMAVRQNEMWTIAYNRFKELKDGDGNLVYTLAMGLLNPPAKDFKMCCRGLIRNQGTPEDPQIMCGHVKCIPSLTFKEDCAVWKDIPDLGEEEFRPCNQMSRRRKTESSEKPPVMVPPFKMVDVVIVLGTRTRNEKRYVDRKGIDKLPCIDCRENPQWCHTCQEEHLEQVQMMNVKDEVTANGIHHIVNVENPPFKAKTVTKHIIAYANTRIARADNEIWAMDAQKGRQDAKKQNYGVAVVLSKTDGRNGHKEKICCRAVARKMPTDSNPDAVECGHAKCTAFQSKEKCFGWKADISRLGDEEFGLCRQMKAGSQPPKPQLPPTDP